MGIDIVSWRVCIGSFHPHVISSYGSTDTSTKSTTAMVFLILTSLTICMDVEPNPGPISTATPKQSATDANSSNSSRTPLHQYTGLFNATKRIRLKLTRYKHHLLNYSFFKENYYIPASLYPILPPFHTDKEKFYRRWRYISHSAAYRHLKLLITECRHKIKELTKELSHHMELLQNSYSPDTFLLYTNKLDSMASSLESLLAHRRAKKAARSRGIINHNLTANHLNQHINNTNASTNDILSNVTHNVSTSTVTRKRSRRKTKHVNIHLDHSSVINLSSCSLSTNEISILSRGLTFCPTPRHINWPEVSADIYDFSHRMRLAEYFFDENSNNRTANEHGTPFHNNNTWNPPTTEKEPLTPF